MEKEKEKMKQKKTIKNANEVDPVVAQERTGEKRKHNTANTTKCGNQTTRDFFYAIR